MLSNFVTVCLALLPFAQCIQIHKHMKREEVLKTFQTEHDNVPDYHVVRLYHTLHKRDVNDNSPRMVKVNVVGRTISLYLEPTEGLLAGVSTPVWTVVEHSTTPVGTKYTSHPNIHARIGRAYQDVSNMAAIIAYDGEDGETLVQGNLQEDIIIHPLPPRLHDTLLRETRDLVDFLPDGVDGEADFRRSHHHVVFKRHAREMNANHNGIRVVKRERSSGVTAKDPSETSIPDIVYPQVLVIVDFVIYQAIGRNLQDIARYVLAFWNGVDLRFRLLEKPIIRLNIAGILISLELRGTPYLASFPRSSTKLPGAMAVEAMSRYFYSDSSNFPFETYDFAIAMTGFDMCTDETNGLCDTTTTGTTYERGACNRNNVTMTTEAVAIVEDNGGYFGILSAVHEVAHLMGAPHDGTRRTIDCPDSDGYLMAPSHEFVQNRFQWSNCSLKYFYDFLSAPESTCLRNKPQAGQAVPRLLPGQLLTLDEQCEKFVGTKASYHDARVCTALACYEPGSTTDYIIRSAAAEGSSCGKEKHCINGHCVSKNARYVPYES